MATQVTPSVDILRREVQAKYTEVSDNPERTYHFHHGRPLAEILGYPMDRVDAMPARAVESFAGVGNPHNLGPVKPGQTVLDVGSGSGFDCFIAGHTVGPDGKVIGVDMTPAMLERAKESASQMGLDQVEFRQGFAEELPVEDASIDVVISNGVINLCPDKYAVFLEIFRTLKPGGRLHLSDIVAHKEIPDEVKAQVDLWTAWIGGALLEGEYLDAIRQAGFVDVILDSTVDVFAGAEGEANAHSFGTMGANIRALKPA